MSHNTLPANTTGWFWRVFHLAWPVILSNLSVPLVGAVDTAMMGHLPDPRFMAAVAVGAVIFSSVFWVFGFLRMGTTGFVAQAMGRNDQREAGYALLRSLSIALLLGVLVIALQYPVGLLTFHWMDAGEDVTASAQAYYAIRIWSAPATFVNYAILGCLIGQQRMRTALLLQIVLNVSNVLLDALFVLQWGMDADGVALASALSEYLAAGLGLWLLSGTLKPLWPGTHETRSSVWKHLTELAAWRALLQVNGDLFVRTLLLTAAFFFFTAQSAQFGTVILAANAILINMLQMIAYGLDGFAHAAEALAGAAYGSRDRESFRHAVRSSTLLAIIMALFISLLYGAGGHYVVGWMTTIPAVAETAQHYLYWLVLAPVVAIWSYQLDGVFIGATQTRAMRNTVALAVLVYVAGVLLVVPLGGNHALWGCLLVFLGLRGAFLGMLYPGLLRGMVVSN